MTILNEGDSVTFSATGSKEEFDISCIDEIQIDYIRGGAGGVNGSTNDQGLGGELSDAAADVSEFDTLEIWVAIGQFGRSRGGDPGGLNSGPGSGSTELWTDNNSTFIAGAGGGGGAGGDNGDQGGGGGATGGSGGTGAVSDGQDGGGSTNYGGDGGDAGQDGGPGSAKRGIATGGTITDGANDGNGEIKITITKRASVTATPWTIPGGTTETIQNGETRREKAVTIEPNGTLDINAGGTLSLGGWRIDGHQPPAADEITATPDTISLSFEATRCDTIRWRDYERAGDFAVETGYAGQFRAVDRGGQSSVTVHPPAWHSPPYAEQEVFVGGYTEEQTTAERTRISLTLQRLSNRESRYSAVSESGTWEFNLNNGTVALLADNVSRNTVDGTTAGGQHTLTLHLDDDQAATMLDNLGYPGGVVTDSVPDGTDSVRDESQNDRQTVTISGPSGAFIDDGDWLVRGWSLAHNSHDTTRRWALDLTLQD